jgi:hypothetical protein
MFDTQGCVKKHLIRVKESETRGEHVLFMGFLPKKNYFEILISFPGNPSCAGMW